VRVLGVALGVVALVYVLAVVALAAVFPPIRSRPQTDRDQFVDVLGSRLAYRVTEGKGPTLLLLHGFGGSLLDWEGLLGKLGCGRLFAIDALGFGLSSRPQLKYELETHRRHLVAFMDALGIDRAIVVGRSFGASLSLWTAAHTPGRIVGAIAMAPSGMPGQLTAPWPRSFLYRPGVPNSIASFLAHGFLFNGLFATSNARQALGISGSYDQRFADALPKIQQETLLLWSPGDVTSPFSYADQYLKRIPHAKLVRFPEDAGHDLASAQPDLAAASVCDFVRSLETK
jgi:pimeloyl-ACP methyl ester carboxylesterase